MSDEKELLAQALRHIAELRKQADLHMWYIRELDEWEEAAGKHIYEANRA